MFFRWYDAQPRGGRIAWDSAHTWQASTPVHDVCPVSKDALLPPTLHQVPLAMVAGGGISRLGVCLLDPTFNFCVSFPAVNWLHESSLVGQPLTSLVGHNEAVSSRTSARGIRVLHWPGDVWKPWYRAAGQPWCRSTADDLWWTAFAEASSDAEADRPSKKEVQASDEGIRTPKSIRRMHLSEVGPRLWSSTQARGPGWPADSTFRSAGVHSTQKTHAFGSFFGSLSWQCAESLILVQGCKSMPEK